MKILAMDASSDLLSLALGMGDGVPPRMAELPAGPAASAGLLPALEALLRGADVGVTDLDAVAWGRGPGAFTGLRTVCSVAQGLALGAGKPLIAVDSLLATAQDAWDQVDAFRKSRPGEEVTLAAVMDARMGEIYCAHYRLPVLAKSMHDAIPLGPAILSTAPELLERWAGEPVRVRLGSALGVYPELLDEPCLCVPTARSRASAVLALARYASQAEAAGDPADALPLYVRDKVAQTVAERMAVKKAQSLGAHVS
jgi:tRNA threonylcarbamoyladenosine biosynthesis protein TsaB